MELIYREYVSDCCIGVQLIYKSKLYIFFEKQGRKHDKKYKRLRMA